MILPSYVTLLRSRYVHGFLLWYCRIAKGIPMVLRLGPKPVCRYLATVSLPSLTTATKIPPLCFPHGYLAGDSFSACLPPRGLDSTIFGVSCRDLDLHTASDCCPSIVPFCHTCEGSCIGISAFMPGVRSSVWQCAVLPCGRELCQTERFHGLPYLPGYEGP
jgi:hypothetical protein